MRDQMCRSLFSRVLNLKTLILKDNSCKKPCKKRAIKANIFSQSRENIDPDVDHPCEGKHRRFILVVTAGFWNVYKRVAAPIR